MEKVKSTPLIMSALDGVEAADINIDYEPELPSDPQVVKYFNGLRPDVWPIVPPSEQLSILAQKALSAFDDADQIRTSAAYTKMEQLANSKLTLASKAYAMNRVARRTSRMYSWRHYLNPEERKARLEHYASLSVYREIGEIAVWKQALGEDLPKRSLLYKYFEPGVSPAGRLAALESIGLNEEKIRGVVAFGDPGRYHSKIRDYKEFFRLTDEGRKEQLDKLAKEARDKIASDRRRNEKLKEEAAEKAAKKKLFEKAKKENFVEYVKSLRQDGYQLMTFLESGRSRGDIKLVKGNFEELRQIFPDLCYPSGLNVFDSLSERHGTDTGRAAVMVGAKVFGDGEIFEIGLNFATLYLNSESLEEHS